MTRGVINNIERAKQINSFDGLQYGNITPTDLDGCIEYHNKAYIFIEIKYGDTQLPFGQRLALERLVKDTGLAKKSIAIIAQHNIKNTDHQIIVKDCIVRELYLWNEKKWRPPNRDMTVKELADTFITKIV